MDNNVCDRILVADSNPIFRETLARRLRDAGYRVTTADSGEHAFVALRDRQNSIDWLYARAGLPILVDGWILADAYHDAYPTRPAIIAATEARPSPGGDIVLGQPSPATVLDAILQLIHASRNTPAATGGRPDREQHAARGRCARDRLRRADERHRGRS